MNFTIKAKEGLVDFSIGDQFFTQTQIALTELSCFQEENYATLFEKVKNGDLEIYKKGGLVNNALSVMSKTITKFQTVSDDDLLNEDYLETKKFLRGNINTPTLKSIVEPYKDRKKDGQAFYLKQLAELTEDLLAGNITKSELKQIEKKIFSAKINLNIGEWISAKDDIIDSIVEGAYTQAIKDDFLAGLQVYIVANYPIEFHN